MLVSVILFYCGSSNILYLHIFQYNSYEATIKTEMVEEEEEGKLDGLGKHDIIVAADEDVVDDTPADCCPEPCYQRFPFLAGDDESPFWQGWAMLRLKTFRLIENTYFETAVITMILLSSLALVSVTLDFYY